MGTDVYGWRDFIAVNIGPTKYPLKAHGLGRFIVLIPSPLFLLLVQRRIYLRNL